MSKPDKEAPERKLPVLRSNGGMVAEIDSMSNASMVDAAGGLAETTYLLAEPANAAHLRKSIKQYQRANRSTTSIE